MLRRLWRFPLFPYTTLFRSACSGPCPCPIRTQFLSGATGHGFRFGTDDHNSGLQGDGVYAWPLLRVGLDTVAFLRLALGFLFRLTPNSTNRMAILEG